MSRDFRVRIGLTEDCRVLMILHAPEENAMTFHEKIRFLREREEMSQLELAALLGVWQNRISQLENPSKRGKEARVEPGLLLRIAHHFDVSVRWLVDPNLGLDQLAADADPVEGQAGKLTEIEGPGICPGGLIFDLTSVIELQAAVLEHQKDHPSIGRIRGPNKRSLVAARRREREADAATEDPIPSS